MESAEDVARALAGGNVPSVIVLDAAAGDATASTRAALSNLAKRVPIVVVASRTESALPLEGAAAVLYRPVRIGEIVTRVKQLLAGEPG